ncbi:hypothetical protein AB5J62_18470 [Amycolatopsis sp. cg5]|uniref:hypothetical protein n=1 Tax=Amycolatopsis sp. cg5 TaxID=3238802 RepID=UPI003526690D
MQLPDRIRSNEAAVPPGTERSDLDLVDHQLQPVVPPLRDDDHGPVDRFDVDSLQEVVRAVEVFDLDRLGGHEFVHIDDGLVARPQPQDQELLDHERDRAVGRLRDFSQTSFFEAVLLVEPGVEFSDPEHPTIMSACSRNANRFSSS